jgi:hypothetical protein
MDALVTLISLRALKQRIACCTALFDNPVISAMLW